MTPWTEIRRHPYAAAGWTVWVASAAVVALRLAHLDDDGLVVAAIALSPWTFVPLLLAGVLALRRRRWVLAAAAALALALPAWWSVSQFRPWSTGPAAGAGWPRLSLLDANVTWTNPEAVRIAREVAADRPDVVALEEVTPSDLAGLAATGVFDRYRWRLVVPDRASAGMALWSDLPLSHATVWEDAGHPELRADVDVSGLDVTLLVVHTFIPVGLPVPQWKREMAGIAAATHDLRGPRVVVGDFNATLDMYELSAVMSSGLSDAAVESGHGWELTWSPLSFLPALVQIDHVLVSRQLAVTSYRLGPDPGSQHRSLLLGLAVRPGGPAQRLRSRT